ncbi:hypothetical protein GEV26_08000 [Aeromicrobium yanjiei]|uniref:5-hmdU DNA kinase helical domain-containing protein n=1 Tax=Aeromicrobium yanjiei TaxID=2662028 RepID=A0A5Q2MMN6_9ACTN|nr:hypothetical protein GEV26_08000 [Aeromicrobium yanjiei]
MLGRQVVPTEVFDTYWRFAARRQLTYEAKVLGKNEPWSDDPIIQKFRFTNCYRVADRVSQYLVKEVAYRGQQDPLEVAFRVLLFKIFNRVSTWELLTSELGTPAWETFDFEAYNRVLSSAFARSTRLYSAAYVMPNPALGESRKHSNHLRLLEYAFSAGVIDDALRAGSMKETYAVLRGLPSFGAFLAYQFTIDLNYSTALNFSEMDFVVPGPGALDGIRKCFGPDSAGIEVEIIQHMAETQDLHFERLGLSFNGLYGRRLQLVDCQNLFCEVDKYARVAHPTIPGISGRSRIKQRYSPSADSQHKPFFPPKWGIAIP